MRRPGQLIAISLGLMALTVAAFAGVARCGFVDFDDNDYVFHNPQVMTGLSMENADWAFTTMHASNWHPLTWLSLQLDAECYGLYAPGYHLTNLALHVASTILLFIFLFSATGAIWRSAAVAAFFAVHPLHVESVAWVTERKDVLSGFFWMLTLNAYLLYTRRPGVGRYALVVVSLALGLMVKQMLVTLPCVLCLLDYWPLRRLPWTWATPLVADGDALQVPSVSLRLLVWEKVPLFVLTVLGCLATVAVQPINSGTLSTLPWPVRLANALTSYAAYLGSVFWPANLSVLYPHPRTAISWWQAGPAGLLLLAISLFVLLQARRRPFLLVGWLWYVGTLVPVIGLVQVGEQARADRYTYLPLIGFFLLLVWGTTDLLAHFRYRTAILVPLTAVLLAACVVGTERQVRYWHDDRALWDHAVTVDPDNASGYYHLARNHAQHEELPEAIDSARAAVRCDPQFIRYRSGLILLLRKAGRDKEADEENAIINELATHPDTIGP